MDDSKILQHLIDLEKQAAALVNDAQTEVDEKVSEREKQNRIRSEALYTQELDALEKAYIEGIAVVKENYRKQLDEYRERLNIQSANPVYVLNHKAFYSLAEKLLLRSGPLYREA